MQSQSQWETNKEWQAKYTAYKKFLIYGLVLGLGFYDRSSRSHFIFLDSAHRYKASTAENIVCSCTFIDILILCITPFVNVFLIFINCLNMSSSDLNNSTSLNK